MCHIITNSLSLDKVIHQLGSTACCHGTCLIFGANKNWSFKSPCEVRALKFFPIKHLLIPNCAPWRVTLTQNIFIIKRSFEISAHRFQRRIITGKTGTIKSLLQITLLFPMESRVNVHWKNICACVLLQTRIFQWKQSVLWVAQDSNLSKYQHKERWGRKGKIKMTGMKKT